MSNDQNVFVSNEIGGNIPFVNKEPENYQAEIVTQIFTGEEKSERKILTMRSGARRLTIFDAGEKNEVRLLNLENVSFSIFKEKKVYAENNLLSENIESGDDLLAANFLTGQTSGVFENLGTENNLTKFLVRSDESEKSETLIYFDENLKIPVKQEFYKIENGQRILTFAVETRNFKIEIDEKSFELPKDYKKVSQKEFGEIIRREELKAND